MLYFKINFPLGPDPLCCSLGFPSRPPPGAGEIRLQKDNSLDFEASPEIQLVVLADNGLQMAHCRVSVTLLDINDNAPLFEHSSYRTAVWEGQVHNTYIMQVSPQYKSPLHQNHTAYCSDLIFGPIHTIFLLDRCLPLMLTVE